VEKIGHIDGEPTPLIEKFSAWYYFSICMVIIGSSWFILLYSCF